MREAALLIDAHRTSRFDALVLGGGTAVCVAARLSEDGVRSVCLVVERPSELLA
jgi:hypothetical protein